MCTALWLQEGCFGRTLDLEYTYHETVTITPRRYPFRFRCVPTLDRHYAIIGMATVASGVPLYYDGMNERGLCMAGLNFPHSAVYATPAEQGENVAVFEMIPYVLGQCATVREARQRLSRVRVCDIPFSADYPTATLHWMLADREHCAVAESSADGWRIYDDPVGVMTNEPSFPHQMSHLSEFARLSPAQPEGGWVSPISRGAGAVGLPGDFSSPSRFVRAAFARAHAKGAGEDRVNRFFHLMATVEIPKGCVRLPDGRDAVTQYTACMDQSQGAYYYRTYENPHINGVLLRDMELDGDAPTNIPLQKQFAVHWQKG